MNIANMPIEITDAWRTGIGIKIGDLPGMITAPRRITTTDLKIVYIGTIDYSKANWEDVLLFQHDGRDFKGYSNDPRLVKIAETILNGRIAEIVPGTILPPLEADEYSE